MSSCYRLTHYNIFDLDRNTLIPTKENIKHAFLLLKVTTTCIYLFYQTCLLSYHMNTEPCK